MASHVARLAAEQLQEGKATPNDKQTHVTTLKSFYILYFTVSSKLLPRMAFNAYCTATYIRVLCFVVEQVF